LQISGNGKWQRGFKKMKQIKNEHFETKIELATIRCLFSLWEAVRGENINELYFVPIKKVKYGCYKRQKYRGHILFMTSFGGVHK
jgi:hypothetical protein